MRSRVARGTRRPRDSRRTDRHPRQVRCRPRKNGGNGCTIHVDIQGVSRLQVQEKEQRDRRRSCDDGQGLAPDRDPVLPKLNPTWRSCDSTIDENHELQRIASLFYNGEAPRCWRKGHEGCRRIVRPRCSNEHIKEVWRRHTRSGPCETQIRIRACADRPRWTCGSRPARPARGTR